MILLLAHMFAPGSYGKWLNILVTICIATVVVTAFQLSTEKSIYFRSEEGHVAAYDKAMPAWLSSAAKTVLEKGSRWLYQHPDKLANIVRRNPGNLDWSAPISSEFFMKSRLWIVVKRLLGDFSGRDDYMAYQVQGLMLRRGDSPVTVKGEANSEDIFCRIFLSKGNTSNSEMIFFNSKEEIVRPVEKKFNRVVMWNASLEYIMKQPGFQTFKTEYSLMVKLSKDKNKMEKELNYIQAVRESENQQKLAHFPTHGEKGSEYTDEFFEKHLTRRFYSKSGDVIAYFDDTLTETELATLRSYLITHNSAYSNTGFTTQEDNDADNVSWIAMFTPEILNNTKILDLVKGMARYLSGEDNWHPYDVSLNMIQSTFHTRIHEDCEAYEHEYTFLLYLNPNWTADMYGETIFLDQVQAAKLDKKNKVIQEKAYETIVSVKPKYGRIAMFRNIIPHSARPPSPDFHGTRYTFAVKLSRSRLIGLSKILKELLEFKQGSKDHGGRLYDEVKKMIASSNYSVPDETLIERIKEYRSIDQALTRKDTDTLMLKILRKQNVGVNQPSI